MSEGPPGLELRVRDSRPRCPYCHGGLEGGDSLRTCDGCQAVTHAECWEEHSGCPACVAPARAPTERRRLRIRARERATRSPSDRLRIARLRRLKREQRLDHRAGSLFAGTLALTMLLAVFASLATGEVLVLHLAAAPPLCLLPATLIAGAYYLAREQALREQARLEIDAERRSPTPDPDYRPASAGGPTPDPDYPGPGG